MENKIDEDQDDQTNIWNQIIGDKDYIKDYIKYLKSTNSTKRTKKYCAKGKKPRT